mgnify:CR=1 FL=1
MVEEQTINNEETISTFLKKISEINQTNGTVEDFAAWTLNNFELKKKQTSTIAPTISEVKEEIKITETINWNNLNANMFNSILPTTINSVDYSNMCSGMMSDNSNFTFTNSQMTYNPNTDCISSVMPENNSTFMVSSFNAIPNPTITEPQIDKPKRGRPSKNKDTK